MPGEDEHQEQTIIEDLVVAKRRKVQSGQVILSNRNFDLW